MVVAIGVMTVAYLLSYAADVFKHTENGVSICERQSITVRREPVFERRTSRGVDVNDDYSYISHSETKGNQFLFVMSSCMQLRCFGTLSTPY